MKSILKVFFVMCLFLSSGVFASDNSFKGNYVVKNYTWCNGPAEGSSVGCWPYGWQRINLGKLVQIQINSIQNVNYITFTDSEGGSWSSNFNPNYSTDGKTITIKLGDTDNSLEITIDDNEISLMVFSGAQFSYLVMNYSKS